jgi:hypothetical protein
MNITPLQYEKTVSIILLAEGIALNYFFRGQVANPCLITRDNGGQEIVTLSLVTIKELRAD